jgi:type VI secretion system ImpJ/VasE family protein
MKPFWPRTLQLFPVHLQARDAYIESLLGRRVDRAASDGYGLIDLAFDEAALARGDFVVPRLEAVFPSGLVAYADAESPLQCNASAALAGTSAPVRVYVGVPKAVMRGPNVSQGGALAQSVRYIASHARGDAGAIPWIRGQAELLFQHQPLDRFETLTLGSIQRIGTTLRFDRGVLPTVLRVSASDALAALLRRLVDALNRRQQELSRYRADHPLNLQAVAPSDLPGLQLAVIVQRYLPLLSELTERRFAHPRELYQVLVALYGALVAFGATDLPPSYDHDEPGKVFPWLFDRIETRVDEAARDKTTSLRFERVDEVTFRLSFDRAALVGKRPFLVASGADETFLRDRVPALLKMATPTAILPLLNSALRGVAIAVEFEPPAVIPRRRDTVAYRLDVRDPLWLDIEDRLQIQLHVLHAPPTLEFVLYGVERSL